MENYLFCTYFFNIFQFCIARTRMYLKKMSICPYSRTSFRASYDLFRFRSYCVVGGCRVSRIGHRKRIIHLMMLHGEWGWGGKMKKPWIGVQNVWVRIRVRSRVNGYWENTWNIPRWKKRRSSARSPRYTATTDVGYVFDVPYGYLFRFLTERRFISFSPTATRDSTGRGATGVRFGGGKKIKNVPRTYRARDRRPTAFCRFVYDLCRAPLDRLPGTTSPQNCVRFVFSPGAFPADTAFNRPRTTTSRPNPRRLQMCKNRSERERTQVTRE